MSNTKRRVRQLKSAAARDAIRRRAAGARAAAAASAEATPPAQPTEASARYGARFIVIERDERDLEPDRPFAVVEAETMQVPENWFGRDWQGHHADREAAETEAAQLNALAERFVPTGTAPVALPALVLGAKPTAWEAELLASTAEIPVLTGEDPAPATGSADAAQAPRDGDEPQTGAPQLPGSESLHRTVAELRERGAATERPAGQQAAREDHGSSLGSERLTAVTLVLPRIFDAEHGVNPAVHTPAVRPRLFDGAADVVRDEVGDEIEFRGISRMAAVSHALDGEQATASAARLLVDPAQPMAPNVVVKALLDTAFDVRPSLHEAEPSQINAGQLVLCSDGSWQPVDLVGTSRGVVSLLMQDGTEHKFTGAVRFWVRDAPAPAPAGPQRPACPNGCARTAADFQLCTCNFGCGCAPHPAASRARDDERELAGAMAR